MGGVQPHVPALPLRGGNWGPDMDFSFTAVNVTPSAQLVIAVRWELWEVESDAPPIPCPASYSDRSWNG